MVAVGVMSMGVMPMMLVVRRMAMAGAVVMAKKRI